MTAKPTPDHRPRFGFARNLDNDPQIVSEKKVFKDDFPVVVIRLPYGGSKVRAKVRAFVNGTLWPKP